MVESEEKVIGTLETRTAVVTIKAGRDGPLYTVADRGDRVLSQDLTESELRTAWPELYHLIISMRADGGGGGGDAVA